MNSYQERLAPIFSQIILRKEYEKLQILREAYERFRSHPYALPTLTEDYRAFDQAIHEIEALSKAHQRIREKCYGICSSCGGGIDLLRLNVHPATLQCLNCDYKRDRGISCAAQHCT